MNTAELRRQRLAQMLDLAQTYRGWTRKDLARALGRDPTKLIPGSGVPKLDLVVDLAGVLDWNVEDVVGFFWENEDGSEDAATRGDFDTLDDAMRAAHREGQYGLMTKLAKRAFELANDSEERARACNREAGGWDGLGRYQNAMKAVQRGLQQTPVTGDFRRMLQSNLANAYYSLWSLVEARSVAGDLLQSFEDEPPVSERDVKTKAFAHYVSGNTARRLLSVETDRLEVHAKRAQRDLSHAITMYEELNAKTPDPAYRGIARTSRGALIEVAATLGTMSPDDAIAELKQGVDIFIDEDNRPGGDELESIGWWCIFGCNIALRFVSDERELQQHMAIFTNKADEIADLLESWAIRERVFTMEHTRWERAVGCTGFEIPCVVDDDDIRIITGTMARFPSFRDTGWQILHSAKVIGNS